MKKATAVLAFFLAMLAPLHAGTGDWNIYLAYHDATYNIPVGNTVYSLMNGNLLEYDTETQEVRLYSKLDGLSERNIAAMGYSTACRLLVLVYDNGNIDLLEADGTVVNVPQLRNATINPVVNQIYMEGSEAYISTSEGLAQLNLKQGELRNFYKWDIDIYCAAVFDGKLFLGTEKDLRCCPLTANLTDPSLWHVVLSRPTYNMMVFADALYYTLGSGLDGDPSTWGLWRYEKTPGGTYHATQVTWLPIRELHVADDLLIASFDNKRVVFIKADAPTVPAGETTFDTNLHCLSRAADGTFWASNGPGGLQAYRPADGKLEPWGTPVKGYGPHRDLCYYMTYTGDRLLLAGGRLDPYGRLHYAPMLATYEDHTWRHFQEEGVEEATGVVYQDLTSIVQDPADPAHHFVSAGGGGVYEFRDYKLVKHYGKDNSTLRTVAYDGKDPNYVRVDGLNFDASGNLWMVNNSNDTLLHVLSPDGKWTGVYVEALKKAPTCERTLFDRRGRLWVASRRTVSNHVSGLLCLDTKGTLSDKDDVDVYRSGATNQDGTYYTFDGVYALAEDHDGAIWVGTAVGLFVVSNPDEWTQSNFRITQVKVPRNDGTNYADYLLNGVAVTALAVDGANRKWIGTDESGLYLVSPDGTEILRHFTAEDSPLLSNRIYSIAPNPATGEVMIGTDKGLCSYMSDASAPLETLDKDQIKVYPNPVRPEYHGSVTVTGLTENADVKITTAGGQVVAAGTSAGGTFVWDVRDLRGERVATGVYFVMVATADGKKGAAARVVVI